MSLQQRFVCAECGERYAGPGGCACGGAVRPVSDRMLGEMIGSYRITRLLGAGGMGVVYRAVHPTIGSRVAVKFLSEELARDGGGVGVARFFAEARAVNRIRHENIVNVLDLALTAEGRPYIVMEHLEGAPLSALIRAGRPLPLGGVVRLVAEVLDALAAAHRHGVVHRDVKPDNVFVTETGRAEVLDFGIARVADGAAKTCEGAVLGTPAYMAPEQARGGVVDARADLWAVGLLLYEAATGRRPAEQPAESPRRWREGIPQAMEAVILRALELEPARRFQAAEEMAQALLASAEGLPEEEWASLAPRPDGEGEGAPAFVRLSAPMAVVAARSRSEEESSRSRRRMGWTAAAIVTLTGAIAGASVALLARGAGAPPETKPEPGRIEVDARALDATAFLPVAQAHARSVLPDAELLYFVVHGVADDGVADLTRAKPSWATFGFRSADGARRPCNVYVVVKPSGPTIEVDSDRCQMSVVPAPKCTMAEAAAKARRERRPSSGVGLKLQWGGGKPQWWVLDEDGRNVTFSDCE